MTVLPCREGGGRHPVLSLDMVMLMLFFFFLLMMMMMMMMMNPFRLSSSSIISLPKFSELSRDTAISRWWGTSSCMPKIPRAHANPPLRGASPRLLRPQFPSPPSSFSFLWPAIGTLRWRQGWGGSAPLRETWT